MVFTISKCHNVYMRVTIDQAGRIVVPKSIRDRLGLSKGSELELKETPEGIFLQLVEHQSALVRENGRLVFTGSSAGHTDWDRLVEEDREDRMRSIGNW